MKVIHLNRFKKNFQNFSLKIQRKFKKQLNYLISDLKHPSLRAKKYNETDDVWQARADQNIRFYFLIESNAYILLDIKKHSK